MARYTGVGLLYVLLCAGGCGGDDVHEDYESLSRALADARPGETVRVAAVRIEGALEVPGGVTLAGAGTGMTVVVAPSDSVGITVRANNTVQTRVTGVSVESNGSAGIIAVGDNGVQIDETTVATSKGIAIGAEGLSRFVLTNVTMTGPVTPGNADSMPLDPAPNDRVDADTGETIPGTGTHGLVLVNVSDADLTNVRTDGFALFGALFVSSDVAWTDGGAATNLGVGVMASGGVAALERLTICNTLQGLRLPPAYATVFANRTSSATTDLTLCDNDGLGMLHAGAAGTHANLMADMNNNAAVWIQDNDMFELSGASTSITNNSFAGVVATQSRNVIIRDATIANTIMARRLSGEVGTVDVGDGVQVVRGSTAVTLQALTLNDNERSGFLADLDGGSTADFTLSGITTTTSGSANGAVAQNGTVESGWDSGVTRTGMTDMNDAAFFAGAPGTWHEIVGVVAPTDLPMATTVEAMGLEAVGVVAPTD